MRFVFWEAMTKTIFKSKMTIPVLMSFTVAILFVLATPPAFAGHSVILLPSSSQTGPVGVTQTYFADIQRVAGWQVDNTQGCVFPALDVVGPFLKISSAPPSFTNYYIISDTPGTYTCNFSITNGFGRTSHPFGFSITATFLPLPPDTCNDDLATCNVDLATALDDLATCDGNLATCTDDLATCDGNLATCTDDLATAQGDLATCDGNLATCIDDLAICEADPQPEKVDICHKGKKTINISSNAVPAHLAHGDMLGACE